ncbi:hypothetical protein E2320_022886 [Naja naja]|nr:hypothetical protein E2320_022886 [Naja naja]
MTYQPTSETLRVFMDEDATVVVDMELRLILVRKSGSGKNAMGNNILGRKEFESLLEAKTTTLQCQKGEGTWQRRKIPVVDTPGIRGFTTEDATAAKCVWDIFGPESTKHTIVVFTCVKDLSGSPLQEYVQKSDNRNLREVMRRCGYRVCGFNNKAEGDERERQVMELMTMVRSTVAANGGRYYTNRLYRMPNVREEHVKAFLTGNKTGRERWPEEPGAASKS